MIRNFGGAGTLTRIVKPSYACILGLAMQIRE